MTIPTTFSGIVAASITNSRLPPELYQQTLKHHAAYQIGGIAQC
jgi:hypothetical protein